MIIQINSEDNRYISKDSVFSISYPNLIEIINSIIDWDKSKFPEEFDITGDEPKMVENRTVLGDEPKLKERVTFYYKDQFFYVVDNDTLGLINSQTGPLGLIRTINDYILPEYKIRKCENYLEPLTLAGYDNTPLSLNWLKCPIYLQFLNGCTFEELSIDDIKDLGEPKLRLPYFILEFLKDVFPELTNKKMTITVNSPDIDIFDVSMEILPNGRVYYDEDNFADETHVMSEILSLLSEKMN